MTYIMFLFIFSKASPEEYIRFASNDQSHGQGNYMGFFAKRSSKYQGKPAYSRVYSEAPYYSRTFSFIYWKVVRGVGKWYVGPRLGSNSRGMEALGGATESPLDPSLKWMYFDFQRTRTWIYDPSIKAVPALGGKLFFVSFIQSSMNWTPKLVSSILKF